MKAQIVVFVAACVLCTLTGTSAASLKKRDVSVIADLLAELESVVNATESTIESAVDTVNDTIISAEKAALSKVNTLLVEMIESAQDEITDTIGNNTITDYITCVNVSNIMTNLTEDLMDAANTCVEEVISPITSAVDDVLLLGKQMMALLESAESVYNECGDLNVLCQLLSLPALMLEALEDAAVDATKVTTLAAELTEIDPSVIIDEVGTCIAEEAVKVSTSIVTELAQAAVYCYEEALESL